MSDLIKYIDTYKDYSYKRKPLTEIDALIYSMIPYLDLKGIHLPITIKDAYKEFDTKYNLKIHDPFMKNVKELFKKISTTTRYQDNIITDYQIILNESTQFAALSINIKNHFKFIAFSGTDDSLIGWQENFSMCYEYPIKAGLHAINFLNKNIKSTDYLVYVTGHSKGGHLSILATQNTKFIKRLKIKYAFNFDGPGFLQKELESKQYQKIERKIRSYYPEESLVGMIMDNLGKKEFIKSTESKKFQHDPFTWQINDNKFIRSNQSNYSKNFHDKINNLVYNYSDKDKKLFVTSTFNILKNAGYINKSELKKLNIIKLINIIKNTIHLKEEEKKLIVDVLKVFLNNKGNGN